MSLLSAGGHGEANQRAPGTAVLQVQPAIHEVCSLPHGNQPQSAGMKVSETDAVIFHLEDHSFREITQAHLGPLGLRMSRDIVQSLLHDAIEVDCNAAVEFADRADLFVAYLNASLFLKARQVLIERAFEPD